MLCFNLVLFFKLKFGGGNGMGTVGILAGTGNACCVDRRGYCIFTLIWEGAVTQIYNLGFVYRKKMIVGFWRELNQLVDI